MAVAAERPSLIKAVLATQSRRITLIHILTGFRVIAQLIAHRTCALGPKWPLDTTMGAASIVVRAALLIAEWRLVSTVGAVRSVVTHCSEVDANTVARALPLPTRTSERWCGTVSFITHVPAVIVPITNPTA